MVALLAVVGIITFFTSSYILETYFRPDPDYDYPKPPSVEIRFERDNSTGGYNWTVTILSTSREEPLRNFMWFLNGDGINISNARFDKYTDQVIFEDSDENGKLSSNDTIHILGEPYGLAREGFTFDLNYRYYNIIHLTL
ncbi:MAG: hypothetical protein JSW00_10265 [Thermoplasmata archaeon]|nr:MAG: hypothetical protein JSW00_10265 [Thermoplasmata archaeon]